MINVSGDTLAEVVEPVLFSKYNTFLPHSSGCLLVLLCFNYMCTAGKCDTASRKLLHSLVEVDQMDV